MDYNISDDVLANQPIVADTYPSPHPQSPDFVQLKGKSALTRRRVHRPNKETLDLPIDGNQ